MPWQGKRRGDVASAEAKPASGEPHDEGIAVEAREDMPDSGPGGPTENDDPDSGAMEKRKECTTALA